MPIAKIDKFGPNTFDGGKGETRGHSDIWGEMTS